jgi:hypothetical protein
MSNKFISIMDQIGKDCLKALTYVEQYLPEASALAKIIFPAETATVTGVVNSVQLIQSAVTTVEQKMTVAGTSAKTGTAKAADVLAIVTPTVTQLLTAEGVSVDAAYLQNVVNAVVGILNVQAAPVTAPAAAAN